MRLAKHNRMSIFSNDYDALIIPTQHVFFEHSTHPRLTALFATPPRLLCNKPIFISAVRFDA